MDMAEPTKASLEAEYPAWQFWRGPGDTALCYARLPETLPPAIVRGEDWMDLRDQIRAYLDRSRW